MQNILYLVYGDMQRCTNTTCVYIETMSGRIPVTGRTVIVGRGSLDFAYRTLNTIMNNMGITKKVQSDWFYLVRCGITMSS